MIQEIRNLTRVLWFYGAVPIPECVAYAIALLAGGYIWGRFF